MPSGDDRRAQERELAADALHSARVSHLLCSWCWPQHGRADAENSKRLWLLVASYYFYAYWDYRFCGLLLLSTVVDYWVALWMDQSRSDRVRRALLVVSLCVNLGVLGLFKYFNFFIESAQPLLEIAWAPCGNAGDHLAGWDFVLHLPNLELHDRCLSWGDSSDEAFLGLFTLRRLLSTARGRTDCAGP